MIKSNRTQKPSKVMRNVQEDLKCLNSLRAPEHSIKNHYSKSEYLKNKITNLKGYSRYILEKLPHTVTPDPKYAQKMTSNSSSSISGRPRNKEFVVNEFSFSKIQNTPIIKRELSYIYASEGKRNLNYFDSNHRDTMEKHCNEEIATQKTNYVYSKYRNGNTKFRTNSVNNLAKKTAFTQNSDFPRQNYKGITKDCHWINQVKMSKDFKQKLIEENHNRHQDRIEIYRFGLDRNHIGLYFSPKFLD